MNKNSKQVQALFASFDELLATIENALKNRTPTLNGVKLLTNGDVIKLLHISSRLLQDWRDTGKISYVRIGGKILYKESDLMGMLEEGYWK